MNNASLDNTPSPSFFYLIGQKDNLVSPRATIMPPRPSKKQLASLERIPRRPAPDFEETEFGVMEGIMDGGLLNVALEDTNQYGPHAMIVLLFAVSSVTAALLMVLTLF